MKRFVVLAGGVSIAAICFPLSLVAAALPEAGATQASVPVSLRGRAVDVDGKPVAGAVVRIWRKVEGTPVGVLFPIRVEPVRFADGEELRTGEDGWFETPPALDPEVDVRVSVESEGRLGARSRIFQPGADDRPALDHLTLRRLVSLQGRVLDRRGQPVEGARVFQTGNAHLRTSAMSDADGRFDLSGLPEGRAFVFVSHPGYRFHGQLVETSSASHGLVLMGNGETVEPLTTLPPRLSRAKEIELAHRVYKPLWKTLLETGSDLDKLNVSKWYAELDPWSVLDAVNEDLKDTAFALLILPHLYEVDPDESLALVEAHPRPPHDKCRGLLRVVQWVPGLTREQRMQVLERAYRYAQAIDNPERRIERLGEIAVELFDAGETERSRHVVDEIRPLAEKLNPNESPDACGSVAEALSVFDLPAALAMIEPMQNTDAIDVWHTRLARRLAARNPAEAERLMQRAYAGTQEGLLEDFRKETGREATAANLAFPNSFLDVKAVAVCHPMASVDLERAHRVALRMRNPYLRAYGLGMIADAIRDSDKPRALALIEEAYSLLDEAARAPDRQWIVFLQSAPRIAAALLPVVERIDPTLVREYAWRAVSFRMQRPIDDFMLSEEVEFSDSMLALLLARYDRDLARKVLEVSRVSETARPHRRAYDWATLATALSGSQNVLELLHGNPTEQYGTRRVLFEVLAAESPERWDVIAAKTLLWIPSPEIWNEYSYMLW